MNSPDQENIQNISMKSNNLWARLSLQTKTLYILLAVALIPVIGLATYNTLQTQNALTAAAEASLKANAAQTASSLDAFIKSTLDSIRVEAQFVDLIEYLTLPPGERVDSAVEASVLTFLRNLDRKDSINILSYAVIDRQGNNILDVVSDNIGVSEAGVLYFQKALEAGVPYAAPVTYRKDGKRVLYFASPIRNTERQTIGILRLEFDAGVLQQIANTNAQAAGSNLAVILLDEYHIRLAESSDLNILQKSVIPLDADSFKAAISEGRLLSGISSTEQATNNQDFEVALNSPGEDPFIEVDLYTDKPGIDSVAIARMENQPWIVAVSQPRSLLLQNVQRQTIESFLILIGVALFVAFIAILTSRNLTNPLVALTRIANSIASGNLEAHASIQTQDEIGELAGAFNRMTDQLNQTLLGLEQRVKDRTIELEAKTEDLQASELRLQRRAAQFEALAQVTQSITSIRDLRELLPYIAEVISAQFGFYHVGVFLLDEVKEYAILSATNSEGGRKMIGRKHRLRVGEQGIVGSVTLTGNPRIAMDVGVDAVFFNNPELPDTHSEMALALKSSDRIVGALDVQSTETAAFTEEDVQMLSLLAGQVSLAIENARLFDESRRALAESEAIGRQSTREAWGRLHTEQSLLGYRYNLTGASPLEKPLELTESGEGKSNGKQTEASQVVVPIELRGETIGTLIVQSPSSTALNQDQIDLIKAVAERVALSAENARLFEETTRRAERERMVSDITGKIRSVTDPQAMIQTAMDELRKALGASRVEVVPQIVKGAE